EFQFGNLQKTSTITRIYCLDFTLPVSSSENLFCGGDRMTKFHMNRRGILKGAGAGLVTLATPHFFTKGAWAQDFCNNPTGGTVTFGLNLPLTGTYAEEGADELKAYELAIKHLNGEGDGGLLNVLKPSALKGNGILGKKVEFVTSDSQTLS